MYPPGNGKGKPLRAGGGGRRGAPRGTAAAAALWPLRWEDRQTDRHETDRANARPKNDFRVWLMLNTTLNLFSLRHSI